MSFFQKNKSILIILLMVGFLVVILSIFVSGVTDSNSGPTPTGVLSQQMNLATSTGNIPATPYSGGTLIPNPSSGTSNPPPGVTVQAVTESPPQLVSSPPPTVQAVTEAPPIDNAPPPPTVVITDTGPLGTDFPPPPTFIPPSTETPPPGNGPPPGA